MTGREREMVIDYWRRVFIGVPDPWGGVVRRFRLSAEDAHTFFVRLHVFEMSETRH